jgi:hypothetical protein
MHVASDLGAIGLESSDAAYRFILRVARAEEDHVLARILVGWD